MSLKLYSKWIQTPLGPMLAVADHQVLYFLEFEGCKGFDRFLSKIQLQTKGSLESGTSAPLDLIEKELKNYFEGSLTSFTTPLKHFGTPFQQQVWKELHKIPFGKTCSYSDLAKAVEHPSAFRAVAQANGCNKFAVIIPCHRVINADGGLGGYGGGLAKKKWLLNHEKKISL